MENMNDMNDNELAETVITENDNKEYEVWIEGKEEKENKIGEENKEDNSIFVKEILDAYRSAIRNIPIVENQVIKEQLFVLKTEKNITEAEREKIRNHVIEANLRLVNYIASSVWRSRLGACSEVPVEDLIQAGNVGLIRAIDKYDIAYVNSDVKFSTYAYRWIEGAVLDEIEKNWKKYELNIDEETIQNELISDEDIVAKIINNEDIDEISNAINNLNEGEKKVLMLSYGIGENGEMDRMPVHKISKELGISASDVKYIRENAEQKIKRELKK